MSRSIAAGVPGPLLAATIHWRSVGPLLVTALAIMGSPGPATISLTAAGSAYGVRRSLGYLAGIVVGTVVVLVAVATGITATLLAVPALRSVLLVLSAAYILWLAFQIATAPRVGDGSVPRVGNGPGVATGRGKRSEVGNEPGSTVAPGPGGQSAAAPSLAGGVLLGVANPKAWVAIAATFASARLADPASADAAAKVLLLSGVAVLIMAAWLVVGASFAPALRDPARARVVNLVLAAALVGATALAILR
jgi:threonine/homoserine/homoserine lactone efflux protein